MFMVYPPRHILVNLVSQEKLEKNVFKDELVSD